MRKELAAIIGIGLTILPVVALAQECSDYTTESTCITYGPNCWWDGTTCREKPPEVTVEIGTVIGWVETIGNWVFGILLAVALIILLIGAFTFLTAAGDPTKVATGRNYIIYALIGVAVAFLAKGMISFVRTFIGA